MKSKKFWKKKFISLKRWQWVAIVIGIVYILTPACGNKSSNNNSNPSGVVCQPGQFCNNSIVSGYPLLPTPTYSALDPSMQSTMVLNWAAPNMINVGQLYNGPVNIAGTLTLAPGICTGLPAGGTLQLNGQGTWVSGYGGYIAQVQGNLSIVGGMGGGVGGTVSFTPALIAQTNNAGGYSFSMTYGNTISIPICGRTFTYYN